MDNAILKIFRTSNSSNKFLTMMFEEQYPSILKAGGRILR